MTDTTTHASQQGAVASAKDEAGNVASTAKEEAAAVARTAVEEAKHLGAEASQQAKHVLSDARQQLQAQAEEQSQRLAGAVGDLGQQLRSMAAAGDSGLARDLMTQAADTAQRLSQQLQQGGIDRTIQDAKRFARNRPGMFLLGAAAAGFAAARVARTADTSALKEAAAPSSGNGANGDGNAYGAELQWSSTEPSAASQPRPTPPSQGTAGPPPAGAITTPAGPPERPLVADPLAGSTTTQTFPAAEPRP